MEVVKPGREIPDIDGSVRPGQRSISRHPAVVTDDCVTKRVTKTDHPFQTNHKLINHRVRADA